MMTIPFVDLNAQYNSIKIEIDEAIRLVIDEAAFIGGFSNRFVNSFENNFSDFLEGSNFASCANGTDSLEIILKAFNIGPGDEVLVPALSWISTAECVSNIGAKPVFVDIKENSFTIDENLLTTKVNKNTRAIIPVHLYGQSCEMDTILEIAKSNGLIVIEDCAQSHGARYKGILTGTMGDASSFSFYPGKNLGAYGDAGGFSIKRADIFEKAKQIANHGQKKKHIHVLTGRNSRLDGIQAAVLDVKLKFLNEWNFKRRKIANRYIDFLSNSEIKLPVAFANCEHVYHLFVIRVKNRDYLANQLSKKGISTSIHYPTPIPRMEAFNYLNIPAGIFPVAGHACDEILSLPIYPEITEPEVQFVCDSIINVLK